MSLSQNGSTRHVNNIIRRTDHGSLRLLFNDCRWTQKAPYEEQAQAPLWSAGSPSDVQKHRCNARETSRRLPSRQATWLLGGDLQPSMCGYIVSCVGHGRPDNVVTVTTQPPQATAQAPVHRICTQCHWYENPENPELVNIQKIVGRLSSDSLI